MSVNRRIADNLRIRLSHAIRGGYRCGSSITDLGCSFEDFLTYLERRFLEGMSWDNYGFGANKWNIDHIKPLCTFDLSDRNQLLEACHYTNLRPMWHMDNIKRPRDGSDEILLNVTSVLL